MRFAPVVFIGCVACKVIHDAGCIVVWRLHYSSWLDFSNSDLIGFRDVTIVISQIEVLTYL